MSNENINIDSNDLICPITYELFRDPVVAGDGHIYERKAIVRWIIEHGTSPLTRQPLNINELQADDYVRCLAAQQRIAMISSNIDINCDHTIIQRQDSTISYNCNTYVDQPAVIQQQIILNNTIVSINDAETHYVSTNNLLGEHYCCYLILIMSALVAVLFPIYIFILFLLVS